MVESDMQPKQVACDLNISMRAAYYPDDPLYGDAVRLYATDIMRLRVTRLPLIGHQWAARTMLRDLSCMTENFVVTQVVDTGADNDVFCGMGSVALPGPDCAATYYARLGRIGVVEPLRGSGIGRYLLGELEAYAARNGAAGVVLLPRISAVPFYRTLGFETEPSTRMMIKRL